MKLAIIRSRHGDDDVPGSGDYLQEFNTHFADKVIGNLTGGRDFCTACEAACTFCRESYGREFGAEDIVAVADMPAVMPYVLEEPAGHIPPDLPGHDILLIINIHEQVLIEIIESCADWGTRGIVVPLEAPDWVSGAARQRCRKRCEDMGVEIAFPKPFCALRPEPGTVLEEFRRHFHIGHPEVRLAVDDGRILDATVDVSAACGATYYVARGLCGRSLDENLEIEVISKRMHSYPCMASMERDPELHDDTPMHIAGEAHKRIIMPEGTPDTAGKGMVVSPMGKLIHKPLPASENRENIEQAKQEVLSVLSGGRKADIGELRQSVSVTPAALNSALLLLKKAGRIRSDGGHFTIRG